MSIALVNHVGVAVSDIDAAFVWYQEVFGAEPLVPPLEARVDGSFFGHVVADIFGPTFVSLRMAHLGFADGAGLELFEFPEPATHLPDRATPMHRRSGPFHLCLTVEDPARTADLVVARGGAQISRVWKLFENKPHRFVYCEDPWGTRIELCSAPYSAVWANQVPARLASLEPVDVS